MNPIASLPDLVRESCARVCETAALVTINPDRLASVGSSFELPAGLVNPVKVDSPAQHSSRFSHVAGNRPESARGGPETGRSAAGRLRAMERSALLVFALDSINFGSGYHDIIDKRPGLSGARSMEANLREFEVGAGPLTTDVLRTLTPSRCAGIFRQELDESHHGAAKAELMTLFSLAFGALAAWLDAYQGQARHAIEAANGSAVTLATMLLEMPYYRDRAEYVCGPSRTVHFYKRAQITPADLQRELDQPLFDDLHLLTAFADNLVPHVLRVEGAITFDQELENQINSGTLLPAGSPAEIEIRAAGIEAVRQLAQLTGRTEMDLDLLLWTQGKRPRYKKIPRHRCRTVFY